MKNISKKRRAKKLQRYYRKAGAKARRLLRELKRGYRVAMDREGT